jgi:hypothetical protein
METTITCPTCGASLRESCRNPHGAVVPDHGARAVAEAAGGAAILHRLVPAPDHGAGFRRDPETGFVYYSSAWLSDQ